MRAKEIKIGDEEEESGYEYFPEYHGTPFVLKKITYLENKVKIEREKLANLAKCIQISLHRLDELNSEYIQLTLKKAHSFYLE